MQTIQLACLLMATLCLLLAIRGAQAVDFLVKSDVIRPSPPRGYIMRARNDQLIGSIQDPYSHKAAAKNNDLNKSTTIIRTLVVTVTETTLLEKVHTKSVTIYAPTVTATKPCLAETQPERQDGRQPAVNTEPLHQPVDLNPYFEEFVVPKPFFDTKPLELSPSSFKPPTNYPVYYSKPAMLVESSTVVSKLPKVKPTDLKPVVSIPVQARPVVVKTEKVEPVFSKPVQDDHIVAKPVSKPIDVKPVLNAMPLLGLEPVLVAKPTITKPVGDVEFEAKPTLTKPFTAKPTPEKATVNKATTNKPTAAFPAHDSPVFINKPNNVQEEFITLMADFTALMDKLSSPPEQAPLVRRFRSVASEGVVWRHLELAVHHQELADELRLLKEQIQDVRYRPQAFYEHLETFVSYMEEI